MRSRALRIAFTVAAFIAFGAAAFFLFQTDQEMAARRGAVHDFDLRARDAVDRLADLRAAQQAYVAEGQGVEFWMPKVADLTETAAQSVDRLRATAASSEARVALMDAAVTITEFGNVDRRARDYLQSGQSLMAGDVVFAEGGETAASAARAVESARQSEHQALVGFEAVQRRLQAYAVGASAALSSTLLLLFAFAPGAEKKAATEAPADAGARAGSATELNLRETEPPAAATAPTRTASRHELLRQAADICTELGRVNDAADLPRLLARAAEIMDASGLVVWMGDTAGGDLRPVLAHGYPPQTLARMPTVPRSANNAAATAYRTGLLQIVLARPGTSNGAVVAPLLSPVGCVGALTAEIKSRGETSEGIQALAAIFAAQLTTVVAASVAPVEEAMPDARTASA